MSEHEEDQQPQSSPFARPDADDSTTGEATAPGLSSTPQTTPETPAGPSPFAPPSSPRPPQGYPQPASPQPTSPQQGRPPYGAPTYGPPAQPYLPAGGYPPPPPGWSAAQPGPWQQQPPRQWSYDGPWSPQPASALPPVPRSGLSRRTKALGVLAAVVLVGGAAVGGAAFGYSHSHSSSATGLASGGSSQAQKPGTGTPHFWNPPTSGQGSTGRGHGDTSFSGGHATSDQEVGVVDIYTKLKYEAAQAAGTGMILTSNGEILTNNHVIEGSTKVKVVVVSTNKSYTARVVGEDKVDDVAVLQLSGVSGLSTVTTASALPQVGDPVTAVGNAMGAGGTPSAATGKVTGINQAITTQSEGGVTGEHLTGLIEVDAQVISGDSGGPLYNAKNEVVGMDTAASSSPTGASGGTGYAIPIGKALHIAQLIHSGQGGPHITMGLPAFLGVEIAPDGEAATGSGAAIAGVLRDTPAARAGIMMGDVITAVDETSVDSGTQLRTVLLSHYKVGQSVQVTWIDSQGGQHSATVKLIAGPAI